MAPLVPTTRLYIWNIPEAIPLGDVRASLKHFDGIKTVRDINAPPPIAVGILPGEQSAAPEFSHRVVCVEFFRVIDWLVPFRSAVWIRGRPYRMQLSRTSTVQERKRELGWQCLMRDCNRGAAAELTWTETNL